ncbi:MAG TPA: hypothetical protein VHQ86_02995 [Candidatus Saccharimonadia bacterium]|jgi:hypothetical protein|nr:hypothetical protein [Candidatus Saccharimonadia bacterium]
MQEDRAWDRIADAIDTKYGLIEHGRKKRPVEDAPDLTEHVSFIIFERDGEKLKLERVQGPAIIDRKTMGARRAGAATHVENVYDTSEVSLRTDLFRWDGTEWQPLDPSALGL